MKPPSGGVSRIVRHLCTASLLVTAALLAGCGSSSESTPPVSALAITTQNSPQAAGAAYQGASMTSSAGRSGASVLTAAVTSGGGGSPNLARFARLQLAMLASLGYTTGTPVASGVTYTQTVSCDPPPVGSAGSVAVSLDDVDNSGTLSSGDSIGATFSNCYLSAEGITVNGGFSLTGLTINGTPSVPGTAWSATATFTFSNLQMSDPSVSYTVQGGLTYSGNTTDGVTITSSLSGTSLSVQANAGSTLTLANFSLTDTADRNTTAYSFHGSGRVTDSALGGYVDFQIPSATPFVGSGSQDPGSGTMAVTGANSTSVKLTVTSTSTVQLQVDTNGDGVYDSTLSEPWSSISS